MEIVYLFCEPGQIRIPLFNYDKRVFSLLASLKGAVWDRSRREFVVKQSNINDGIAMLKKTIELPCVVIEGNSLISYDKQPLPEIPPATPGVIPVLPSQPEIFSEHWRVKIDAALRSRKYSPRTISAYIYYNSLFCRITRKTPEEIKSDDLTQFLASLEKNNKYSSSSMNLALSAIKFFYAHVYKKQVFDKYTRPHLDQRLPLILSKEEVSRLIKMELNPKHRLLLMLVYSSGLRVSEVAALKKEHIDLSRMVIYIKQSKGRKDRFTILSEKAARNISEYCQSNNIETWLFPGQPSSFHLSIRSAQNIFYKALRHAGIHKNISIHSLRHSFATHLLESGTDIRYIQSLLGHTNIRTTERYTHVARRDVLTIKSPLNSIYF
jgi:site-specific recombinase XerD